MPLVHMSLQTRHVEDDNSNLCSICIGSILTHDIMAYYLSPYEYVTCYKSTMFE